MELRPPSYFALAALTDGPLHVYAIVRRARELSDGRVRLSTGTLYALLDRATGEERGFHLLSVADSVISNYYESGNTGAAEITVEDPMGT